MTVHVTRWGYDLLQNIELTPLVSIFIGLPLKEEVKEHMISINSLPDTCTAEEAVDYIAQLAPQFGIQGRMPDVRTLRLWRSKALVTVKGRSFIRRNVLEVLVMLKLQQEGFMQQNAAQRAISFNDDDLRLQLVGSTATARTSVEADSMITLQLLARGIVDQFNAVRQGAIVGHTDRFKTGFENTPRTLREAMARLGRLYFISGLEDRAASVHELLGLCMTPLATWAPPALTQLSRYRDLILIDPSYRVPSEDCASIVEEMPSGNISDLVEHHLHDSLREILKKLGSDSDYAYTTIREFLGRHPMVSTRELLNLTMNPELTEESIGFVRSLYTPVHHHDAVNGYVRRCAHCYGLIRANGRCVLDGCQADYITAETEPIPLAEARLAQPEVLKFWIDPAREELRLYDTLRSVPEFEQLTYLYPNSDRCDVAIGEEVGIDVKDYRSPILLGRRLNRSIGGLIHYKLRILAIAQRRWSSAYTELLVEQLSPDLQTTLKVMSVDETILYLTGTRGGYHA